MTAIPFFGAPVLTPDHFVRDLLLCDALKRRCFTAGYYQRGAIQRQQAWQGERRSFSSSDMEFKSLLILVVVALCATAHQVNAQTRMRCVERCPDCPGGGRCILSPTAVSARCGRPSALWIPLARRVLLLICVLSRPLYNRSAQTQSIRQPTHSSARKTWGSERSRGRRDVSCSRSVSGISFWVLWPFFFFFCIIRTDMINHVRRLSLLPCSSLEDGWAGMDENSRESYNPLSDWGIWLIVEQ
ncbi:hypothetical protein VTO42DRAFT_4854 [Malbranchea cinnamomea]